MTNYTEIMGKLLFFLIFFNQIFLIKYNYLQNDNFTLSKKTPFFWAPFFWGHIT